MKQFTVRKAADLLKKRFAAILKTLRASNARIASGVVAACLLFSAVAGVVAFLLPKPSEVAAVDFYTNLPVQGDALVPVDNSRQQGAGSEDDWLSAAGTENDPYIITTGVELNYLATLVNGGNSFDGKYIELQGSKDTSLATSSQMTTNVIDLILFSSIIFDTSASGTMAYLPCDVQNNKAAWTPIGTSENPFQGTIYGKSGGTTAGIDIYNLGGVFTTQGEYGLFGYLGDNAVVRDIHLKDVQFFVGSDSTVTTITNNTATYATATYAGSVGAIAGACTSNSKIENCSVTGLAPGLRTLNAAGNNLAKNYYVPDFTMRCDSKNTSVGGLVGKVIGVDTPVAGKGLIGSSFNGKIVSNSNTGAKNDTLTSASYGTSGTGGLVGYIDGGFNITNCRVGGIGSNILRLLVNGFNFGGFVGYVNKSLNISLTETETFVTTVAFDNVPYSGVTAEYCRSGGIIGFVCQATNNLNLNISGVGSDTYPLDITFSGSVLPDSGKSGTCGGFGGIIGLFQAGTEAVLSVSGCYVTYTSTAQSGTASRNNLFLGGIIGRVYSSAAGKMTSAVVSDCHVKSMSIGSGTDIASYQIVSGGIIGAVGITSTSNTGNLAGSRIENCTVSNFVAKTDGFTGGIVGTAFSTDTCGIAEITGCSVVNATFSQRTLKTGSHQYYQVFGGIAPAIKGNVTNCTVTGLTMNFSIDLASEGSEYPLYGGIAGHIYGASTISGCLVDATFNIGNRKESINPAYIGGIAGVIYGASGAAGTTITGCGTSVRFSVLKSLTRNTGEAVVITDDQASGSYVAGGLIGSVNDSSTIVSIDKCFTTGFLSAETLTEFGSARQSTVGGFIGSIYSAQSISISNGFSTASLNGNLDDAVGGIIGINASTNLSMSDCSFGGTVLLPNGASIVKYTNGGTFTGLKCDFRLSPQLPSADGIVSATSDSALPAISTHGFTGAKLEYYNAARNAILTFTGSEHVFAYDSAYPTASSAIVLVGNETAVGTDMTFRVYDITVTNGNASVTRRVKLIHGYNKIHSGKYGTVEAKFNITSASDIARMQEYVKHGGGYLGAQFEITADITSSLTAPIGGFQTDNMPFCGVFDGGAKTLTFTAGKALNTFSGMFGYVENASFEDLELKYTTVTTINGDYRGGATGYAFNSTYNNVNVFAITSAGISCEGGVAGYARSSRFVNCSFSGLLKGGSDTGGIAGYCDNGKPSYLISNFTADKAGHNGIRNQYIPITAPLLNSYFDKCFAAGDICGGQTAAGINNANTAENIGGIVGNFTGNGTLSVRYSFAYGNVSGGSCVGGLIGKLGELSSASAFSVSTSYMSGDVYANDFAGGLVGSISNSIPVSENTYAQLAANSYFAGQIRCKGVLGALTSAKAGHGGFYYDAQLAGTIDITGNAENDPAVGLTGNGLAEAYEGIIIPDGELVIVPADIRNGSVVDSVFTSETYAESRNVSISFTPGLSSVYNTSNSTTEWKIHSDNSRIHIQNNANAKMDVTFYGTDFELFVAASNWSDALNYTVTDSIGNVYTFGGATYTEEALKGVFRYWNSTVDFNGTDVGVRFLSDVSPNGNSYQSFASLRDHAYELYSSGNNLGASECSVFKITDMPLDTYKITISYKKTRTVVTSIANIAKFIFGYKGVSISSDYKREATNHICYPELLAFDTMSGYKSDVSAASVKRLYDFTTDIDNRANAFSDKVTEKTVTGVTYTRDSNQLTDCGVTYSSGVYTKNTTPKSDSFDITSSRAVNGYTLGIVEHITVTPFTGAGTADDPFEIPDVEHLVAFRDFINSVSGGAGLYFELNMGYSGQASDTTKSGVGSVGGYVYDLSSTAAPANWNTPIGTEAQPFQGHFTGNGKLITNFYSNGNTEGEKNYGLFGVLKGATLENLTVEGGIGLDGVTKAELKSGLLAAYGTDVTISGVTVRSDGKTSVGAAETQYVSAMSAAKTGISVEVAATSTGSDKQSVGNVIGALFGDSTVVDVLSVSNISVTSNSSENTAKSFKLKVGGVVGYANPGEDRSFVISEALAYGTIKSSENKIMSANVGGIIGEGNGSGNFNLSDNAFYGELDTANGGCGGIAGRISSEGNVALEDCYSNAYIKTQVLVEDNNTWVGGIVGNLANSAGTNTMNNCVFGGEIYYLCADNGRVGGILGTTNGSIDGSGNYFDSTKNYGFSYAASSTVKFGSDKKTYELLDAEGRYAYPAYTTSAGNSTLDSAVAEAILLGGSTALNSVITSEKYKQSLASPEYCSVSSAYVSSASSTNGITVSRTGDNTNSLTLITASGRRIVSYKNMNLLPEISVTAQVVKMVGGTDALLGYGKKLTYYPSVEATGFTDASYIMADPAGDGIICTSGVLSVGSANGGFMIFNEDQLEGVDTLISGSDHDGYGGKAYTDISATAYTVGFGCDIVFDNSTYFGSNYYDKTIIGERVAADIPFKGKLDGNYYTLSGVTQTSTCGSAGLFALMQNATVENVGITDSYFSGLNETTTVTVTVASKVRTTRTVVTTIRNQYTTTVRADTTASDGTVTTTDNYVFSGDIGSLAAVADNVTVSDSFCSARIDHDNASPNGINIGGFFGRIINGASFDNSYFTGSVGIAALDTHSFPLYTGTGTLYSGGFAGTSTGNVTIDNSYSASYIHGEQKEDGTRQIGLFIGRKESGSVTFTGSSADYSAGSASCAAIGNDSVAVSQTEIGADGLYDGITGFALSNKVKVSRIPVSFSTSASSLSTATIEYTGALLTHDNYTDVITVWEAPSGDKYLISDDGTTLTRTNNGIASFLVKFGDSSRIIIADLQCWYDNYTEEDGVKTYTIKNASELIELAELLQYGDEPEDIGHGHQPHTGAGIAADGFATATIQLGANITIGTDVQKLISVGTSANKFSGTFDGNGYSIINAAFESDTGIGLFAYVDTDATIKNVMFTGETAITVKASSQGNVYGGMVASQNDGTVIGCSNGSKISITDESTANLNFGAIIGINNGTVSDCYNMQHISALSPGDNKISGIVGENAAGATVTRCYNSGILEGYYDGTSSAAGQPTAVSGITVANAGTVSNCYNAGVLYHYKPMAFHPIAINTGAGTTGGSYVVIQTFVIQQAYSTSDIGTEYSTGVTKASAASFSDGTLPAGFDAAKWTAVSGRYPQLREFTDDAGDRAISSRISSVATVLDNAERFDGFTQITFPSILNDSVSITENNGNLGSFERIVSGEDVIFEVRKKGVAVLSVESEDGSVKFVRETYFINEESFSVRYMFDFSELLMTPTETTQGGDITEYGTANTFADVPTRLGIGTAGDPYLINTSDDLVAFSTFINNGYGVDRYFKLVNDIDCTSITDWVPIGTVQHPFYGIFNGAGHTIHSLKTVRNSGYVGLFGYAGDGSVIRMTAIENCLFTATVPNGASASVGAIAGYTSGTVTNCYSRSVVRVNKTANSTLIAGGLVGELAANGAIFGCYNRPATVDNMWSDGSDTVRTVNLTSYVTESNSAGYYGGLLVGKTAGNIRGCYTTATYYSAVNFAASFGVIAGWYTSGEISNVFYSNTQIQLDSIYLYVYLGADTPVEKNGEMTVPGNVFEMTDAQLKSGEFAATTNGVANDGAALTLSENLYLGTYEMKELDYCRSFNNATTYGERYTSAGNDGYPILSGFDIAQYRFASFDDTNLILFTQNKDASEVKIMTSLCSYGSFDFPLYANIVAKDELVFKALSIPRTLSYNVSAVGYGYERTGEDMKWVAINGSYTTKPTDNTAYYVSDGQGSYTLAQAPYSQSQTYYTQNGGVYSQTELANLMTSEKYYVFNGSDYTEATLPYSETETYYFDDNGVYTEYTETEVPPSAHGPAVINNELYGEQTVPMGTQGLLPQNCDKMYVYITLRALSTPSDIWGVYHSWDSSQLEEILPEEVEE